MTDIAPSAMSPTTLAKPIMCTSMRRRRRCGLHQHVVALDLVAHARFRDRARTSMGSIGLPVASFSSTMADTSAPEKSLATRRPRMPALRMFSRTLRERLGRRHELRVDHVAGLDAVLDHFHVAHVGREQRLHARAVDAVHDQHFVGGLLERVEERRA